MMGHPFSYGRGPVREPLPFFNEQMWCGLCRSVGVASGRWWRCLSLGGAWARGAGVA